MLDEVAVPLHIRYLWTYIVDSANLDIYSTLKNAVADDSLKLKTAEDGVKVYSRSKLLSYLYGFLILHPEVKHQFIAQYSATFCTTLEEM